MMEPKSDNVHIFVSTEKEKFDRLIRKIDSSCSMKESGLDNQSTLRNS